MFSIILIPSSLLNPLMLSETSSKKIVHTLSIFLLIDKPEMPSTKRATTATLIHSKTLLCNSGKLDRECRLKYKRKGTKRSKISPYGLANVISQLLDIKVGVDYLMGMQYINFMFYQSTPLHSKPLQRFQNR